MGYFCRDKLLLSDCFPLQALQKEEMFLNNWERVRESDSLKQGNFVLPGKRNLVCSVEQSRPAESKAQNA